ncbi:MAG: superoxide dismutase family protein [Bdellovibrionota bacterium]
MNISAFSFIAALAFAATPSINEKMSAELQSKNGSQVSGQIDFTQMGDKVTVTYKIKNLSNKKKFGLHIHEKPDCSSADGKSAGGHYAKLTGHEGHGTSLDFPDLYAGDLPQISSNSHGVAEGSFTVSQLSISGGVSNTYSLSDRAIIVHGGPDDKTKKSAPRIACGLIKSTVK